jgi:hypothetical protein
MGRAETEKISQDAGILFFQGKEFFARSQAAFHFHGTSPAYSPDKFKADVDSDKYGPLVSAAWKSSEAELLQNLLQCEAMMSHDLTENGAVFQGGEGRGWGGSNDVRRRFGW